MYTTNWNKIILSLVVSITWQTAIATVTNEDEGLALGQSGTSNIEWSPIIFSIFNF